MPAACRLLHEALMFGLAYGSRLVYQHHGDAFADFVAALQAGVVEEAVCLKVIERAFVFRAGEYVEQRFVYHLGLHFASLDE